MLDKHFARLLAEYDDERTGLEASIAKRQRKIESWNADILKTDPFTRLVKCYTDFSRLATLCSMRLSRRRLCLRAQSGGMTAVGQYTFVWFYRSFAVAAHIVTPAKIKEQHRLQQAVAEFSEIFKFWIFYLYHYSFILRNRNKQTKHNIYNKI